jgi:hypothetical protein
MHLLPLGLICLFLLTAVIIYCARLQAQQLSRPRAEWYAHRLGLMAAVLMGLWFIGPPAWFLTERDWLWERISTNNLPSIEAFKYSQDLAWKFWLPAIATLIALVTGKLPGLR